MKLTAFKSGREYTSGQMDKLIDLANEQSVSSVGLIADIDYLIRQGKTFDEAFNEIVRRVSDAVNT